MFYLLKAAFDGHIVKSNFGYGTTDRSRLNILDLEETILRIHWRLAPVIIENLPHPEILERYDRAHTFFYLDPPYYGMKVYRLNFESKDFEALAQALARIKGKFLMSLNDHPQVQSIFKNFEIQPVTLKYSCMGAKSGGRAQSRGELLISNYQKRLRVSCPVPYNRFRWQGSFSQKYDCTRMVGAVETPVLGRSACLSSTGAIKYSTSTSHVSVRQQTIELSIEP